ncbi:hypothetical protein [Mesorhizobium sp. B2-4-6]|uniref:hypothetical protein n=1 Tax=Mesorhizobium sp. B2-4-6 TaxID=2589943 RepID=UPI0011282036|nr:hypothetical protein [Mesorhizobium sp. B2-4-6]TPL40693.1 hypothetical protein FJ957_26035 [Mesorhizobium sp. B2-4-6]
MARLRPGSVTFEIVMQQTLAATQRVVVETAKREHAVVMHTDPRPSSYQRWVDGQQGVPEEAVKPTGVIVYRYPRLEEVIAFALQTLADLSPELTGAYKAAHTLFLNGAPAALSAYQPGDDVAITNPEPYSRKIEVGSMKMKAPGTSMVYQHARRVVMARFGNIANIKFTYRGLVGGFSVNQLKAGSTGQKWWLGGAAARSASGLLESAIGAKHGRTAHNRSNTRFPVLEISER